MRTSPLRHLLLISVVGALMACGHTADVSKGASTTVAPPSTIVLVVMENHGYDDVVGNPDMPFVAGTIMPRSITLTAMHEDSSPSLPNYVWMAAGSDCGAAGSDTTWDRTCPSLFDQLLSKGIGWTIFAEGYPGDAATCSLAAFSDGGAANDYARKHVPSLLFTSTSSGSACTDHVRNVPGDTPADGAAPAPGFDHLALPAFTVVIPNLCHDMHNDAPTCGGAGGGAAGADRWLSLNWAALVSDAGPNGVVILTWDEGEGGATSIPTFIAGQRIPNAGTSDGAEFDHSSTLRAIEDAFGLPCLQAACGADPLPIGLTP